MVTFKGSYDTLIKNGYRLKKGIKYFQVGSGISPSEFLINKIFKRGVQ